MAADLRDPTCPWCIADYPEGEPRHAQGYFTPGKHRTGIPVAELVCAYVGVPLRAWWSRNVVNGGIVPIRHGLEEVDEP